ncbi:transmembrane protease serine 9-like [Anopheles ziemanni]|uniref:transmembrane protease serine 9-like n=1 Tax=Anopheles coustani TaxID=139045 RepID=UPI002658F8F0|nr:transmembrane protease serine 9-like [Anopheles coustani]XP_058170684.1 transmembrane protease serine 9-like [Anopheles ziemanni]
MKNDLAKEMPELRYGVVESTVQDDKRVYYGEYPWMAAFFQVNRDTNDMQYCCNGALIEPFIVITTANCFSNCGSNPANMVVRLGEWVMNSTTEPIPHEDFEVEQMIKHPDFHPMSLINNIALVVLKSEVQYKPTIQPICLPSNEEPLLSTQHFIATGWGATVKQTIAGVKTHSDMLKQLVLHYQPFSTCVRHIEGRKFHFHESFACTTTQNEERPCKGDAGAPVVVERRATVNQFYLYGLVSWGWGCHQTQRKETATVTEFQLVNQVSNFEYIIHLEEQWLKSISPTRTLTTTSSTSTTTATTTTTTEQFLDYPDWNGQCGERYIGEGPPGSETKRWEFPWSVALFSITNILGRHVKVFLCGATLIDDQAVLTTAKCVQHQNRSGLVVHIGRWNANSDQEPFMQEIKVEKVVIHPEHYTSTAHIGNIALLFLADSAQIGPASNRVCLPDTQEIDTNSFCYVVGWSNNLVAGTPNHLLKIDAQYANRNECQTGIRNYGGVYNYNLPKEHLCADYTNTPAPCERVEGSGMVCALHENSEQFFLVDKVMTKNNRYPNYYRPDLTHE